MVVRGESKSTTLTKKEEKRMFGEAKVKVRLREREGFYEAHTFVGTNAAMRIRRNRA